MIQSFDTAVNLTCQMVDLAEAGMWNELAAVEKERSVYMQDFFQSYQGIRTEELESQVRFIQEQDKNILRMALSAKDGLRLEMAQAHQTRRAVAAYAGR